jgi:hypothetical protein
MTTKPKQYEILPDESDTFQVEDLEEGAFSRRGAAQSAEREPVSRQSLTPALDKSHISSSSPERC